ncbi:hypothetical protein EVAR_59328_1 [Eumeta japonica]|uniref:Uncharacterized protein n=1 Tax=Eumeta variegata TaxID=151549 RepID=A0A4C1YTD6_EUMVA|nr:hypothetical protein EVAR_59328_1 [Eumeta japonica]
MEEYPLKITLAWGRPTAVVTEEIILADRRITVRYSTADIYISAIRDAGFEILKPPPYPLDLASSDCPSISKFEGLSKRTKIKERKLEF